MSDMGSIPALGSLAEVSSAMAPEIAMLLETADRLLKKSKGSKRFRSSRGDLESARRNSIWATFSSLGLSGVCAPARLGGSNMDLRVGVLLAELIGRNLAPEPFIACSFFPTAFLSFVGGPVADRLLTDAINGIAMPVMAVDDRDSESSAVFVSLAAGKAVVRGEQRFVHGAAWATHFIISGRMEEQPCVVIVPAAVKGLSIDTVELADGSLRADIRLDGVELDSSQIVATGADCQEWLRRAIDWTTVAIAAELFGVETTLFGVTLDYLKTRTQFDRLIGSFQALQHRAVGLYCGKEIARYVIAETMQELDISPTPLSRSLLASRCKARAAESAFQIGRESVQMHGAMGFSDESDVGLYLKRSMVLSAWLGGQDHHRRRFSRFSPPMSS
jgi:alkylation response protein AidB-like acyl-CoA dehydrogenase